MFLFLIRIAYWQASAATHSSVQMRDFKVNLIRTMFISANHALETETFCSLVVSVKECFGLVKGFDVVFSC